MATTNIINTATGVKGYQVPGAAAPAGWTATPTQVAGQITSALAPNPHDAIGYNPATDPTSTANPSSPNYNQPTTPPATATPAPVPAGQTAPVSTAQPNPATVNATPSTSTSIPSGIAGDAPLTGSTSDQAGQAIDQLKAKYGTALSDITGTGVTPPQSQGSANAGINAALGTQTQNQPQYDSTQTDAQIKDNEAHQQYLADFAQSQSTEATQESFTQMYSDLSNQLGLPAVNTALANITNIIDGTEQNIRDEVTAAGGFATESQVQALATTRNKTLIQQQKELSATRDNLQTNLTTMIGLDEKDRAYAQTQIDNQLNFDQKNIDFADKAVSAGQESLKNMEATEGWSGIYQAALATGDPQAIQRINSTMGNGFDLASVAAADAKTKAMTQAKDQASLAASGLSAENAQLDIQTKQQNLGTAAGLPNPAKAGLAGFSDTGVKLNNQNAQQQIVNQWKADGGLSKDGTGTVSTEAFNNAKAWWTAEGLTPSDFDAEFAPYKPGLIKRAASAIF